MSSAPLVRFLAMGSGTSRARALGESKLPKCAQSSKPHIPPELNGNGPERDPPQWHRCLTSHATAATQVHTVVVDEHHCLSTLTSRSQC